MKNQLFFYPEASSNGVKSVVAGVINDNKLTIARSQCSPKDRFDKHKGRAIALGRALSNRPLKKKVYMSKGQIIGTNKALLPRTIELDSDRNPVEQFLEVARSL